MTDSSVALSADQAQEYVQELNNNFGLGSLPAVRVLSDEGTGWRIQWEDQEEHHSPMTSREWREWLEQRFGPGLAERLETSEG
jgi:hypothetical protein